MLRKAKSQYHFYLMIPSIFDVKAGMQVYSAFFLQALQELYPESHYDVFLRCDRSASRNLRNLQFLRQKGFHCFGEPHYETNRWRRRLRYSLGSAKILGLGIWKRPTLILSTELNTYTVVFDWFKRWTGVPYWVVLHGLEAWNIQNSAHKKALRRADRIIAVSHYTRDRLLSEGYLDPDQISVLPNTFDASQFQIKPKPDYLLKRYGLSPEQPVILTVTRLDRIANYKGYDKILQALPQIRQQIPNVHYILAGKGDDRTRIESMISSLDLQDCVTLAGFVPEDELCDHYNLCDVFAMPSKGEGFGIVYLEALACGKPVLAGNKDGAVDPLAHGELGCLVDPDDGEAIAHSLIQILQGTYPNPLMYQPEQLRQKTSERFEFAQFRQTLAELIQNYQVTESTASP
jgi:glycosyltransferase involved in cell wall biosynthesis